MKIEIDSSIAVPCSPTRVGNVYPVRGGKGSRYGHMHVVIAITDADDDRDFRGTMVLMLVVSKNGKPVGVNSYGLHYVDDLQPIAFVDGIEDLTLLMRSL